LLQNLLLQVRNTFAQHSFCCYPFPESGEMMRSAMLKVNNFRVWVIIGLLGLAGCTGNASGEQAIVPTATLPPIISMTPRFTATPVPTRTPLPTDTLTPSETPIPPTPSDTPTPTDIPPIIGIVASINTVNVREGPGVNFTAFIALPPGTRVVVLGQNPDGRWINIQLEDGREGWISNELLRLQETMTPIPTATPSPDLTALAQGTPLPTAILGGGTVTPTPPRSVISPTPVSGTVESSGGITQTPFLPIIDVTSINLTATALAGGIIAPTNTAVGQINPTAAGLTGGGTATLEPGIGQQGNSSPQQGVDVLAYCNNPAYRTPAPTNLAAGSTIDIWWSWYAKTEEQVRDHIANAIYDVRIDGVQLQNLRLYQSGIRLQNDGNYYVYWYVPAGPLTSGPHEITYTVSWSAAISDGYEQFGPVTSNPLQSGKCTFTVQ
jgi:hypothetical protein